MKGVLLRGSLVTMLGLGVLLMPQKGRALPFEYCFEDCITACPEDPVANWCSDKECLGGGGCNLTPYQCGGVQWWIVCFHRGVG